MQAFTAWKICVLAWEDTDPEAKTITVSRNLTPQGLFTPPKTEAGNRAISMIDAAAKILRNQRELTRMYPQTPFTFHTREYGERIEDQKTFVFNASLDSVNGRSGAYYSAESLGQTGNSALRRAGLRHRKAYQSRHTFACQALSAGVYPNDVAAQRGHSDAQMVYQVYGSWMKENDEAQRSLLNEKLNEFVPSLPCTKIPSSQPPRSLLRSARYASAPSPGLFYVIFLNLLRIYVCSLNISAYQIA
ncbi:hypothetical protein [Pantoea sp. KPR_PJ]|uniref:hypothetical protein n=1 Tax=Pantoea sp. KPR_PJ TaxID=2738375 RepID=UPI003527E562